MTFDPPEAGGSKVVRGIIARKEGEPGNEATSTYHYTMSVASFEVSESVCDSLKLIIRVVCTFKISSFLLFEHCHCLQKKTQQ